MKEMKDIEAIIKRKAQDKATKEVGKFIAAMNAGEHLRKLMSSILIVEDAKLETVLVEKLTEIYLPEETKKFVEAFIKMKEQMTEYEHFMDSFIKNNKK